MNGLAQWIVALSVLATFSATAADTEPRHRGPITDLLVHGDRVLSCSQAGVISETLAGGDRRWLLRPDFRIYSLALIPARRNQVVIGGGLPAEAGILGVFDIKSGELITRQQVSKDLIYSVAIDPGSTTIAAACADGDIVTLSLDKLGSSQVSIRQSHTATARDVTFSADGSRLASCGHDGVVLVSTWSESASVAPRNLAGHSAAVHCLTFSPDGQQIASGASNGKLRLHSIDGPQQRTYSNLDGEVSCVSWSPQGLFVGTSAGTVYRLSSSDDGATSLIEHSDPVFAVAASTGGELVVAGFDVRITKLPRE